MRALAVGSLVALAACSLPNVGLWSATGHANTGIYELYGTHVTHGGVPYRPGFTFEYPPGAIAPLAVPALPHGSYVPWFHAFEFACLLAAVAAVALTRRRLLPTLAVAVMPALLGQITLNSFELWPAALAAGTVWAVARGRPLLGFALLAVATAAKLYPVLLAPALLAYVARTHGRRVARNALLAGLCVLVAAFLPFAAIAPGGLKFSLEEQLTRGLQVESLGGSLFGVAHQLGAHVQVVVSTTPFSYDIGGTLATVVATVSSLVVLAGVYAVQRALLRGPLDLDRTVVALVAVASAVAAFAKVLSPQYLLFLVPLVAFVDRLWPTILFACTLVLTQVWARFPGPFNEVIGLRGLIWVTFVRNLLLVSLFAGLLHVLSHEARERETYTQTAQAT